jgi:hypothetical protein
MRGLDGFLDDVALLEPEMAVRVPPYQWVLQAVKQLLDGELRARLEAAWAGRDFHVFYDRPLLLLAALRFDALLDGRGHPLWDAIAARDPIGAVATVAAVEAAFARPRVWEALGTRYVQTNETSRAVAWLWPAALLGARSFTLVDLGASAGLNLVADALGTVWTDVATGAPLEVARVPSLVERLGLDARPLDLAVRENAMWLRACVWPGELDRLGRLEAAIGSFSAVRPHPRLETLRARDMPARLSSLSGFVLAYQTVMREYLDADERAAYVAGMRAWLSSRPAGSALWVELESARDGATRERPAELVAHVAVGGAVEDLGLALTAYHPRELAVDEAGVRQLRARLA